VILLMMLCFVSKHFPNASGDDQHSGNPNCGDYLTALAARTYAWRNESPSRSARLSSRLKMGHEASVEAWRHTGGEACYRCGRGWACAGAEIGCGATLRHDFRYHFVPASRPATEFVAGRV
jgi:hypothetical protein